MAAIKIMFSLNTIFSKQHLMRVIAILACGVALILFTQPSPTLAQSTESECIASGGTWFPQVNSETGEVSGGTCQAAGASISNSYQAGPVKCESWGGFITNLIPCTGRVMAAVVAAGFINIFGTLLGLAGMLFNSVIQLTIVGFNEAIYGTLRTGITTTWEVFRDISNIVIIGMFTFIAIQKILGIEGVGTNKMIARVLIIAILINFSLFFTNVVIGTSNFIAVQFYRAALATSAEATLTTDAELSEFVTRKGISGQFIQLTGLPSAFKARDFVTELANDPNGGWYRAAAYGFVTVVLILGVAVLLTYATFLLFVRTVLFIILLVTSSIAFASYLIPSERTPFHTWWRALLKNAILGPLLLIFIWVTLTLGNAFANRPRSLASLFSDPLDPGGFNALFFFLLMLGMLYASIHFAHRFANDISGFGFAKFIGAGLPAALSAQLAALGLQNTVGRQALKNIRDIDARMANVRGAQKKTTPGSAANLALGRQLDVLDKQKQRQTSLTRSDFDVRQNKHFQQFMKSTNVPKALQGSGVSAGGLDGRAERLAKEIAGRAKNATKLSDGDMEAIKSQAHEQEAAKIRTEKETAQMQREAAQTALQAAQASKQAAEEQHTAAMKSFETTKRSAENQQRMIETTIKQLERDKEYIPEGTDGHRRQQEEIHRHQSALNEEKERITRAHESVKGFEKAIADATRESEEHRIVLDKLSKVIEDTSDPDKITKRITNAAEARVRESHAQQEEEAAHMVQRLIGQEVRMPMQLIVEEKSMAEMRKGLKKEKMSVKSLVSNDSHPENRENLGA